MGLGIALVASRMAQVPVTVVDTSQKSLDKGLAFAGKKTASEYRQVSSLIVDQTSSSRKTSASKRSHRETQMPRGKD